MRAPTLGHAVLVFVVVGCASGGAGRLPSADVIPGLGTASVRDAPVLTSLPPVSTYAFIDPSRYFHELTAEEERSPTDPALESLRESVAAVLRGNGWREASADSAAYHIAVVYAERTAVRRTQAPDPRGDVPPPRTCDLTRNAMCREPRAPRYPPISTHTSYTDRTIGAVIERVGGSERRWWVLDGTDRATSERYLSRQTLELLLAAAAR
jgi:hypothetical protein